MLFRLFGLFRLAWSSLLSISCFPYFHCSFVSGSKLCWCSNSFLFQFPTLWQRRHYSLFCNLLWWLMLFVLIGGMVVWRFWFPYPILSRFCFFKCHIELWRNSPQQIVQYSQYLHWLLLWPSWAQLWHTGVPLNDFPSTISASVALFAYNPGEVLHWLFVGLTRI